MTITFAAAKKLFDEKKYQQALQVYEELGKLYGQNVVEYNIQLCEKQLNEILKKHNTGLEALN